MFCKYCGTEIDNNASFCPHCGKAQARKSKKSLIAWFKGLVIRDQILLLIYCALVIAAVAIWGFCDQYNIGTARFILFIVLVVIPFITICVLYYTRIIKPQKASKKVVVKNQFSLKEFSKDYGQMRVRAIAHSSDGSIEHHCVFVKETKVSFAPSLGELSAKEISQRKGDLVIVKNENGAFELINKSNS